MLHIFKGKQVLFELQLIDAIFFKNLHKVTLCYKLLFKTQINY